MSSPHHWADQLCTVCRTFNCKYSKAASLAENLAFLREVLCELGRGHKVVVFVLDEFDLFAKKAKQTTLYNLLDAMQSADMQVLCFYMLIPDKKHMMLRCLTYHNLMLSVLLHCGQVMVVTIVLY